MKDIIEKKANELMQKTTTPGGLTIKHIHQTLTSLLEEERQRIFDIASGERITYFEDDNQRLKDIGRAKNEVVEKIWIALGATKDVRGAYSLSKCRTKFGKKYLQALTPPTKEEHRYYCDDCGCKWRGSEAKCPQGDCGSTNVAIDEPIIRVPKPPTKEEV